MNPSVKRVAMRFVGRINAHDVPGLVGLMATDHVFVDSLGRTFDRPQAEGGWRQYFQMVPDYRVDIERTFGDGGTVVLTGWAGGTFVPEGRRRTARNRWRTPAAWTAQIEYGRVAAWRVYSDNEPIRERMRQAAGRASRRGESPRVRRARR